nr:glycoside hydrolase family 2 TIM barrel-domain containing protein [Glycomyces tenuis]
MTAVVVEVVDPELTGRCADLTVEAVLTDAAGDVASCTVDATDLGPRLSLPIPADRVRLWGPGDPHLYGLTGRLREGDRVVDEVESYAGLRSVAIDGNRVLINGEPVFQRLVLDQGYWPDTLMTAPDDDALRRDIELAMATGFNGARLHQKVFEERFYYHADRLGYLAWGEFGDWGAATGGPRGDHQQPTASFITQWLEVLRRDRSHPSIIGWCPLNETYQQLTDRITQLDDVTAGMYLATKLADPTRPVIDASGYAHRVMGADVYDSHSYEQDPAKFAIEQGGLAAGEPFVNTLNGHAMSLPYAGQPYFVSECGGIWWNAALADTLSDDPDRDQSWGYGDRVRSVEEWHERFAGLTNVLLGDPDMFGYCYTQLTDVFQEENGVYDFQRRPKFDIARIRDVQTATAAYEEPQVDRN